MSSLSQTNKHPAPEGRLSVPPPDSPQGSSTPGLPLHLGLLSCSLGPSVCRASCRLGAYIDAENDFLSTARGAHRPSSHSGFSCRLVSAWVRIETGLPGRLFGVLAACHPFQPHFFPSVFFLSIGRK